MIETSRNIHGELDALNKSIQLVAKIQMSVEEADNVVETVVGTGDRTLIPPTGFVLIPSYIETSVLGDGTLFTHNVDGTITLHQESGVHLAWEVSAYFDVSHSSNNSTVGSSIGVKRGGSWLFRPRAIHAEVPNLSDIGNMSGFGFADAVEDGDAIGIHLASDSSGDVRVHTSGIVINIYKVL